MYGSPTICHWWEPAVSRFLGHNRWLAIPRVQDPDTSPNGESFKYVLQMHFPASNNAAEYEALLYGLRIATALSICRLRVLGYSFLVVNQANKEWSCLDDKMMMYC
jgi:hypothetical protein